MDLEKYHIPTKAPDQLLDGVEQNPRAVYKCSQRQQLRKAFAHGAGLLTLLLLVAAVTHTGRSLYSWNRQGSLPHLPRRPLSLKEREELFLSIPTGESALEASRAYATHPHLAGSSEDLLDAKAILHLFQDEFDIPRSPHLPIYDAGSPLSRNATLLLTTSDAPNSPRAWIDTYYPIMNTGVEQALEILDDNGDAIWIADLVEDGDPRDEDAHKYRDTIPPWHGYSADGDVTGQLIYANYGGKEDYDELVAQGTNFTGKIIITRYGVNFRGIKIQGAELLGAAGVLIYSDPRDDGFVTTKNDFPPYPAGPARNPSSIQRGSVQFLSTYPGDPSTPGYPAYLNANRTEAGNIPKIPSLPISWQNAQKLLGEIDDLYTVDASGKKVLSGNASKNNVRLVNRVDTKVTPIWNVMASIPGHIKNEVVLIGCHRDAWVMGAADPTSGTVSLHEIIRAYGALLKKGWKPLRTIVIASWDGEEYGLVGSVEWGEDFGSWISDHVVAYLNVDVSVAGSQFVVFGSPSLAHLIKKTANDVPHPTESGKTLWDALDDEGPYNFQAANLTIDPDYLELHTSEQVSRRAAKTRVMPLGSGSDFTVFLQRLGIASSEQSFAPTLNDAVYHYHSIYDSQSWQERYGDPGFHRHAAVAKHLGLLGLRLTDSIVLPINTTQYALELHEYLDIVEKLLPTLGEKMHEVDFTSLRQSIQQVQEASHQLDEEKADAEEDFKRLLKRMPFPGRRGARCTRRRTSFVRRIADWVKSIFGVPPPTDTELQLLSLRHANSWEEYLEYATDANGEISESFEALLGGHGLPFPIHEFIKAAKRVARSNKALKAFELGFISENGIKNRQWYKHLGVAPGKWLGYGATTLPALTEAIVEEKNTTLIQYEARRLENLLIKLASTIKPEANYGS
ncbi:putative glutamate carboxypeptidase [Psilocybe cubensis]|uniref:Glutamate carboxypeptidase n=2 Tax=Psilocybe cubensis TaxID=181762 RepID=A0ACB8H564_PSICU|nr:putative glutamate carboxypeptidase [Psilocybe cubensis]KAH9482787.1 putative glutamate carboxypeptidase [Psilocybe cubensis]